MKVRKISGQIFHQFLYIIRFIAFTLNHVRLRIVHYIIQCICQIMFTIGVACDVIALHLFNLFERVLGLLVLKKE